MQKMSAEKGTVLWWQWQDHSLQLLNLEKIEHVQLLMLEAELTAYKQINLYLINFALVKSFPGPKFMIDIWLWAFGSQLLKV